MTPPPVLIEIRPSQMLKGQVGLFAVRAMPAGFELVNESSIQETFEPWSTYESMDAATRRKTDAFCVNTPDGFWMPKDFNLLPACYFINHSCAPNVAFNRGASFIIFRDVQEGEELCWDFQTARASSRTKCKRMIFGAGPAAPSPK